MSARLRRAALAAAALSVAAAILVGLRPDTPRAEAVAGGAAATAPAAADDAIVQVVLPETLSPRAAFGKKVFDGYCARCHGANAAGREGKGPPLVHRIYEPGHHGDQAFLLAPRNGVRAHHWRFGDMPPVRGVSEDELRAVVAYVRELQRANGIK